MTVTEEQYEILAKAFMVGQSGYEDDWEDEFVDDDCTIIASEDLDAFVAGTLWNEAKGCIEVEVNGVKGVYWDAVQPAKGDKRNPLAVIDCGDFRLMYHCE